MCSKANENVLVNNKEKSNSSDVDGFSNWLIVMMSINVTALICENLTRFGLIATPLDIVHTVICLILEHWWLLFATAGYFILQMLHTFLIEKLLSK
ncbi:hypothetical protein ILUMI_17256, partial [Ignelater luminosus]